MFGQIDHTAEIGTSIYFFGFQRTDKVNINYFLSVENYKEKIMNGSIVP